MGFFEKIKQGLSKTASSISSVFTASELDDDFYDDLEERLILADLGMDTTVKAVERLRLVVRDRRIKTVAEAREALREVLCDMLDVGDSALNLSTKPSVVLVIGVNGVGKTTTIGKIANQLHQAGKKVLLCAGDTFRAAAADQLEIWAERAHADIIRQGEGADPASVVFDAISAAKARGVDVILCDTAGRLHNKANLMNELGKISRIIDRELPDAAKEVLLVLDGTTGQNGLLQAKQIQEIAGVTGIALTKLDVLSYMDKIPLCAHDEIDGVQTDDFPFPVLLDRAKPVMEYMPGWQCDISGARRWEDLPEAARSYVEYVEKASGCPIGYVSVGAERESLILR